MKKNGRHQPPVFICARRLWLVSPAAQAADTCHRDETQGAVDPLGVVVLVGHYDELPGSLEPLTGDLAQQLTAEAPVAPILMGTNQLEAPHGAGEEEAATGDQATLMPDPPPLSQSIGDHGLIEVAP